MEEITPIWAVRTRAGVEAELARIELWYSKAIRANRTMHDVNDNLVEYARRVFAVRARAEFDVALQEKLSPPMIGERIELLLQTSVTTAFDTKYPYASGPQRGFWMGLISYATRAIRSSAVWRDIQGRLLDFSEWEAAGGDDQALLKRSDYKFSTGLAGQWPRELFRPRAAERWRRHAWKYYRASILSANRPASPPANRREKVKDAILGLAYDLAVLKANEILARGLFGDAADRAYVTGMKGIEKEVESEWRSLDPKEARSVQVLAAAIRCVRKDLLRVAAPATEVGDPSFSVAEERRTMVDVYIAEVRAVTGVQITRRMIWQKAGYNTDTDFQRWQRADPRTTKKTDDRFRRLLLVEKPHLKSR